MKIACAWIVALAVPTLLTYAAFPARPGPDVPFFVMVALVIWWAAVSSLATSELVLRRRAR